MGNEVSSPKKELSENIKVASEIDNEISSIPNIPETKQVPSSAGNEKRLMENTDTLNVCNPASTKYGEQSSFIPDMLFESTWAEVSKSLNRKLQNETEFPLDSTNKNSVVLDNIISSVMPKVALRRVSIEEDIDTVDSERIVVDGDYHSYTEAKICLSSDSSSGVNKTLQKLTKGNENKHGK
jgi:hypothetical protein